MQEVPLSHIHRELRRGGVTVNGTPRKGSYRLNPGDVLGLSAALKRQATSADAEKVVERAWSTPAAVHLGTHVVAFVKPPGIPTIGAGSLAEAVEPYLLTLAESSLSFRPGPLHRLDTNTSGLVLFSRSIRGARRFSELQDTGQLSKLYLGIIDGLVEHPAEWKAPLIRDKRRGVTRPDAAGRQAWTAVWPLETRRDPPILSLCLFVIRSGFTHQIRAHAAAAGTPLWRDTKYGGGKRAGDARYRLHAGALRLSTYDDTLSFRYLSAPPPKAFCAEVDTLFGKKAAKRAENLDRFEKVIRATLEL